MVNLMIRQLHCVITYSRIAKSERSVCAKEAFDKITSFLLNMWWKFIIAIHDLLVNAHRVVIVERWITSKHLKNKDTKSPPVHVLVVTLGLDNLGSEILRRSTQCHSLVFDLFCEAKVGYLYMTFFIYQKVLWF